MVTQVDRQALAVMTMMMTNIDQILTEEDRVEVEAFPRDDQVVDLLAMTVMGLAVMDLEDRGCLVGHHLPRRLRILCSG